jgi:hypothetical protein
MPTIATQTDECVDVISRLNDEYDELDRLYERKKKILHDTAVVVCELKQEVERWKSRAADWHCRFRNQD